MTLLTAHRSLNVRAPQVLRDHLVRPPRFTSKGKRGQKRGKGLVQGYCRRQDQRKISFRLTSQPMLCTSFNILTTKSPPHTYSEWPKSKTLTPKAGEDVQLQKLSFMAGGKCKMVHCDHLAVSYKTKPAHYHMI